MKFKKNSSVIAIIMGSKSDLPMMKDCIDLINEFDVSFHLEIISAHRTPERLFEFASTAHENNFKIIIAGAGGAAHLPGMCASLSTLPVIGIPMNTTSLEGMDSLLSIVQMPRGVPVATVAINNSFNAGILALQILATNDIKIANKLKKYKDDLSLKVKNDNLNLNVSLS